MNQRDAEYVWNRLAAPASDAMDAYERLKKVGEIEAANRLMVAMQAFTDECRAIRTDLQAEGKL